MRAIGIIAFNTFRENLRDRILYNLLFFAFVLIGGSVVLGDLTIMEHHKIVTDMGLAAINVVGVTIGMFVGIGLVSKEIERRTVYTIMARPITRTQFVLGKYAGLVITLMANMLIMFGVFVVTLWVSDAPVPVALLQAVQLILVEALLVTAIALFFSTFTSSTLSAILTIGVFVIGHLTTDLKGIAEKSKSEMVKAIMNGLYYVCPNLEVLNVKGQAAMGQVVSMSYQMLSSVYGLLYAGLLIAAACLVFEHREFR